MKKFITGIALVAATASMAYAGEATGAAQYGERRTELRHARRDTLRSLDLTEAQRQQIRALREADRDKNGQLYRAAREKRAELRRLRRANDPRAESVRQELQSMRAQLDAAHDALRAQLRGVLTAEQRAQLDARRQAHHRPSK
jgi:Spy/CpxP family protein refolding chaperone